jgi:hypothetical protein
VKGDWPRRSPKETEALRQSLYDIVAAGQPMTVRSVFYRAVAAGLVHKNEGEYRQTVDRLLVKMRKGGELPYEWIVDDTRWAQKPDTFSCLDDAVAAWRDSYQRELWDGQPSYVEVWCEKHALSGVLSPVTSKWHVPLLLSHGFFSTTCLHDRGEIMEDQDRPVTIYYVGDHDPSGVDIERNAAAEMRERHAPGADLTVKRLAVTPDQIVEYGLQTRPTKPKDSRTKKWPYDGSVEVDAIDPVVLRRLVEEAITSHLDPVLVDCIRAAEAADHARLASLLTPGPSSDPAALHELLGVVFGDGW